MTGQPKTRGECIGGPRPCPWRQCRYHLGQHTEHSCALDVADEGCATLEEVGAMLGVTRERARQIEAIALRKLLVGIRRGHLAEYADLRHGEEVSPVTWSIPGAD